MLIAILVPLGLGIMLYVYTLGRAAPASAPRRRRRRWRSGAVVSVFDTLRIGCFAPTTAPVARSRPYVAEVRGLRFA